MDTINKLQALREEFIEMDTYKITEEERTKILLLIDQLMEGLMEFELKQ